MQIDSSLKPAAVQRNSRPQAVKTSQPLQTSEPSTTPDQFVPSGKGRTSFFHRVSGSISGGMVTSVAGALLLAPAGNGMGGEGLIYPLMGFAGGGLLGLAGGAILAGSVESKPGETALLHRANGVISGAGAGATTTVRIKGLRS